MRGGFWKAIQVEGIVGSVGFTWGKVDRVIRIKGL